MVERRKQRQMGRRLKLTPDVEKRLVQLTRAAVPIELAAQSVGISRSVFMLWLQKGREEQEFRDALAEGTAEGVPDRRMNTYVQLWNKIAAARADSASNAVVNIQRVATGGAVLEETTRKYRDPNTGEWVEETTVKRQAPDWRASAFILERQHGKHFGKDDSTRVEITGAGGGAVRVESVDAEALAEKVRLNLAALGAGAAVAALPAADSDGIDDAVIVDDAS